MVGDNLADDTQITNKVIWEYTDAVGNTESREYWNIVTRFYRPVIIAYMDTSNPIAAVGEKIDLIIAFDNVGGANATEVWINLTAAGFTYVNDNNISMPGIDKGGMVYPWKWHFTNVTPGGHILTVSALVDSGFVDGDRIAIRADCDYAYGDTWFTIPNPLSIEIVIKGRPVIELEVTIGTSGPSPGTDISYLVSFDNIGNAPAKDVWINASIPQGMSFVSDTHASIQGVDSAVMVSSAAWHIKGVDIGPHDFAIVLKGDHDLADGSLLIPAFGLEYSCYHNISYGPSAVYVQTVFKRPVFDLSVSVTEMSPEPGETIIFTVNIENSGSVSAGAVMVKLVADALGYVEADVAALNGTNLGNFTFLFPGLGKGNHSFDVVTKVDSETTKSFIDATFNVDYADTTNSTSWETNRTVRLTLEMEIPMIVPSGPINMLPVLILVVAMIGVGSMLLSENTKYGLFFFFLPLYTKLRKKNILEHETRGMIRGYVIANPGDHFNSIKKALSLNNGTLAYHLHVLEREGLIKSKRWGKFTRFYPSGMKLPENGSRYSEIQKIIMSKIGETPGISQKEIAAVMGVTKSTINYHINRLTELGVVDAKRAGIKIRYFLVEDIEPPDS
jgi:uncharacterized repeat protein (TIGR01451 family)